MKKATTAALLFALSFALAPQRVYPLSVLPEQNQVEKQDAEKLLRDGRKAFRKGEYRDAVQNFLTVLNVDPTNVPARLWASYSYYKGGDYQSAFKYAQEVIQVDEKNA